MKPDHYAYMEIDVIEFCQKNNLPFDVGNVIKYVVRFKQKGGIEDLKKAKEYIDRMIDYESRKEEPSTESQDDDDSSICAPGSWLSRDRSRFPAKFCRLLSRDQC